MKRMFCCLMLAVLLPLCALADAAPYTQRIGRPDEPVFAGPCYDAELVATVQEAGVYTIVEECMDDEGNLWGRLKSGLGWIDLTHVRAADLPPFAVSFAAHGMHSGDTGYLCVQAYAEYTNWLCVRACAPLHRVRLTSLEMADDGWRVGETLLSIPDMAEGEMILAGLAFPGDMTTYALFCTDSSNAMHVYGLSLSGRNGLPVISEMGVLASADQPVLLID